MGLAAVAMLFLAGSYAQESSDAQQQVKARLQKMSELYNAGEYKEAFDMIVTGGHGYIMKGGLMRMENEESKQGVVEFLNRMRKEGWVQTGKIQDLEIHANESGAVATYISDETHTTPQGEKKNVQLRATEVWIKTDSDWMLYHWHYSEMTPEESGQ